jgi:hypothetical protein
MVFFVVFDGRFLLASAFDFIGTGEGERDRELMPFLEGIFAIGWPGIFAIDLEERIEMVNIDAKRE